MANLQPDSIRNVVLLSHSGAGKTSLTEAMLFTAGTINRLGRVDEGATTSDYDPDEIRRKIGINLSLLPLTWKNKKINLLDAPGYADFIGEALAAIRVADSAIFVVGASSGVEVGTELIWKRADESKLPRIIVVNKMDRENADFFQALESIQAKLGKKCLPVNLPIGSQSSFAGTVDLIAMKAYTGDKAAEGPIPAEMEVQAKTYREKLLETAVEIDDTLISKYLEGKEITSDELNRALRKSIHESKLVPVLAASALKNIGAGKLMDTICEFLPSPAEVEPQKATNASTKKEELLKADPAGPLAALVFKTSADPYVGKLTFFRVYSGTITSNTQVWNSNKSQMERTGQLLGIRGKTQEAIPQVTAGDIGAVAKLSVTTTGDTLAAKEKPFILPSFKLPSPSYSVSITPKTKVDVDKIGSVLPRMMEEDPTLRFFRDPVTGDTVLSGVGETHLVVVAERMQRKFGVDVIVGVPKVPYKETLTQAVKAEYKHKKQTGGHGQYGHVLIEVEPLPRGSGTEFTEHVVGGTVPKNFIPAVEKGVNEGVQEGILARFPVVDVRATLVDGSYHPVDSSEICFKIAGAGAIKKALTQGGSIILEPIMVLKVTVPDEFTGGIMSDLNTKRARVMGMTTEAGSTTIEAQVPQAEVLRYATDLRSITQGRGFYTMEPDHYEEVPAHITQKIIADRAAEKEKAEKA